MASAYPQELRDRVLAAYDRGMKTHQIADVFQVSPAWARRVKQRRRETGETTARPMGGVTVVKVDVVRLRELVEAQPDATVRELHERLGIACSVSAVDAALKRLKLTLKKKRFMRRNRTGRMLPRDARSGSGSSRSLMRVD